MRFPKFCCAIALALVSGAWAADTEGHKLPLLAESMTPSEWRNFARIGCGYYPIPEHVKEYLPETLQLAQSLNASYEGKTGYSAEKKQQIEFLFLQKKDWDQFPKETAALADEMAAIGQSIVRNVLRSLEIEPHLYKKITGGLTSGRGKDYFKIAHYDASKNVPGLLWHKDIRFVTVLYINQEGLQGKVNDEIIDIKPLEGYFIINLGVFFEALFNDQTKLSAFVHQVQKVSKDRVSFGAFCEGNYPAKGFYQLQNGNCTWMPLEGLQPFLIKDNDKAFATSAHNVFGGEM